MEWYEVDQHPDDGHCSSCYEDMEYSMSYAVGDFLCCCASKVAHDTEEDVLAFAIESGQA